MISIFIKPDVLIKHVCIDHKHYLMLKKEKRALFRIPFGISFGLKESILFFQTSLKNDKIIKLFKKNIEDFIEGKIFRRIVRLKGLGYRIIPLSNSDKFEIRLGFSRKIILPKFNSIYTARFKKQQLILEGPNEMMLSNFVKKIKRLRPVNVYSGKGVYQKRETLLLKDFKK